MGLNLFKQDLASAVKGTQNLSSADAVRVTIPNHQCSGCGVPMRFSTGGVAYFRCFIHPPSRLRLTIPANSLHASTELSPTVLITSASNK